MRKQLIKYLFLLLLISLTQLFSQKLSDNWKRIKADEVSSIYIEPEKIVEYGNEISVWAIEKLREPKELDDGKNILTIKTHYLFNKVKKKYAEIGAIYYDERGIIVNRDSKSSFAGGPMAFMSPLSTNPNVKVIYKEVISYLITGNIAVVDDTQNDSVDKDVEQEKVENTHTKVKSEDAEITKAETKDVAKIIPKTNDEDEDDVEIDISGFNRKSASLKELKRAELPELKLEESEYNLSKERAIRNTIFTDGNLFCVQVSSWKKKNSALREVNKLIAKGYNAYIVSVKPKHKRSIWHRVRVGYFNSLKEAKRIQHKIRY